MCPAMLLSIMVRKLLIYIESVLECQSYLNAYEMVVYISGVSVYFMQRGSGTDSGPIFIDFDLIPMHTQIPDSQCC